MPTVEELEAIVLEKDTALTEVNTKLATYTEKLGKVEDLESFLTLKTDRDNLKTKAAKVTELEKELKELKKANNKNGDDDIKAQLETKQKELDEANGKLTEAEAKAQRADELEADIIKELMDRLPKEHKEVADGLSIPKLRAYVKLHGVKSPADVDNGNASDKEIKLTTEQKKEAETLGLSDALYYEVQQSRKKKETK